MQAEVIWMYSLDKGSKECILVWEVKKGCNVRDTIVDHKHELKVVIEYQICWSLELQTF